MMPNSKPPRPALSLVWTLAALCAACSGQEQSAATPQASGPSSSAVAAHEVPTATWPADPCAWIPVAEVESIVGRLAGPPGPDQGGCRYPLVQPPPDAETLRRREAARKLEELARKMGGSDLPPDRTPKEPAIIVTVRLSRDVSEQAAAAGERMAASWAGLRPDSARRSEAWDYAKSPIVIGMPGFFGRTGELSVMVTMEAIALPDDKLAALADRVRDRIPDKPFRDPSGEQTAGGPEGGPDPCSLLTSAEAEEALGKLEVPPYRTRQDSPYPDPSGNSCAYYTAGHRVLALTPQWSYGESALEAARMTGGLVTGLVGGEDPEAADTLEGPWDAAASVPFSGSLVFLKGDRSLEVGYGTSSTDAAGAVRLAMIAVERLDDAKVR